MITLIALYNTRMRGFNYTVSPFHTTRTQRQPVASLVQQDSHRLNDYGMLSKAVMTHLKKKKKKKPVEIIRADNYQHCRSLDKLQLISEQRNQEIKMHILEKAELATEN